LCYILPEGHKKPTAPNIWGGWSGVGVGEAGLNRYCKNSLELALIARLKSEMKRNGMKY